jgi:dienelactone hydrolase
MPRLSSFAASLAGVVLLCTPTLADGPSDNIPAAVRRVPKPGIKVSSEVRKELEDKLAEMKSSISRLSMLGIALYNELMPDVIVCYKAVHDALVYDEFFSDADIQKAREVLTLGKNRLTAMSMSIVLRSGWQMDTGLIVRGYVSKIDGSVQPYGLVIPRGPVPRGGYRLDVWMHGRGETLSEVNFIDERRKRVGDFSPAGTIVLHPYGRFCNANKFAGEVDVLEAIESVMKRYPIDPDRVAVRGFSMGGASCWQFAVHYSDRWFAANPGAGFAETPRFLNVFQRETLTPTWYEQKLWHLYDCTDTPENLAQCPTVAYSGELDNQKQAADVMAEALEKVGMNLTHVIGPKTKHAYHPAAKLEVEAKLASLADVGRIKLPTEVHFATYTLKYNKMNWVTIDAMGEHWEKAKVKAVQQPDNAIYVTTENVTGLTLDLPPGVAPFSLVNPLRLTVDGTSIEVGRPRTDRSLYAALDKSESGWKLRTAPPAGLVKRHDLQGPIDDAFMDAFVMVRPTGKSSHEKVQAWSQQEMARAIEHWRRHFRGDARVKDDTQVSADDLANMNLVLWGDAESNSLIRKIAGSLPIAWTTAGIKAGDQTFDADNHALILIYPNPLNPDRYVVLNSGFTFRDYDYLNNARQVPKLPDWAVIDLRTPPDSRYPGKVVAANFFGEKWELKAAPKP